jgi:hypothetical protein
MAKRATKTQGLMLTIYNFGNDAFTDQRDEETARILETVAAQIRRTGQTEGKCIDANGNTVGHWAIA